jgi:hypothetical protein
MIATWQRQPCGLRRVSGDGDGVAEAVNWADSGPTGGRTGLQPFPLQAARESAMVTVCPCALPVDALLGIHARDGAFTDCYTVELAWTVTQAEYVEAFYTSAVFKIERWLIARLLSRPSTDVDARQLAAGTSSTFAAWSVEQRSPAQLLVAAGRTRSWLMTVATQRGGQPATRLYFGSAVLPRRNAGSGASRMGWPFRALLGFHRVYSRVLLAAACRKLAARR